mgnify:FL=1
MIKKLIKDIIKGERGFNKGEGISPKRKVSPKRREYLQFPSFGEGGVAESRGGRWIHNVDNKRFMHSPTTSPYGYSSFPKEESCRYYRL